MLITSQRAHLDMADELICAEIETLRKLARDSTWQGCAETTEVDALRALAGLLEVRSALLDWQREHGADCDARIPEGDDFVLVQTADGQRRIWCCEHRDDYQEG